ncbi:hypothetical protein [Limnoglobus roseus]|uniref:Uncharacterized protein n=1 Tax=Limnoglobus roseus TaxID=2598579 RepID=A0A5C1ABG5_9BACT|nr:hypothetical protein [Limnoglobus roseus]QEL15925.1 hypothetical protein PX52LOC_02861 [Limnoglobus roseus]
MRRLVFTSFVLMLLTAWVSGQPAATGPTAGEQLHMFQRNRDLLENLVEHSVELANANTPVGKVRACHESTKDLGRAIKDAADRDDADRVAELSEHLTAVIKFGLVPTVDDARTIIPVGTPDYQQLLDLTAQANGDAERFELSIPALGKIGASNKVSEARGKLHAVCVTLAERTRR